MNSMLTCYYGPPEGGQLFDIHLNIVTALLRDSAFSIELILGFFLRIKKNLHVEICFMYFKKYHIFFVLLVNEK